MKIILLKDVAKVGKRYDSKEISDGYALNLLIPKGLAIAATPEAIKKINIEKSREEGERKLNEELVLKNISELNGVTVNLIEKANEKGHLFAAIHKPEIIKAILDQTRLQVAEENIVLDKPIKEIGSHNIKVSGVGKNAEFVLEVKEK